MKKTTARLTKFLPALLTPMICTVAFSQAVLDPVTVTAGMHDQNISSTGRNITTIKGEQFYNLPIHSLDELLRFLPGIEVQQRGPMGSQSDIVIRGGTFQQVLVVLDGMRVNDPVTGHFNSYIPIAPIEIDRIEILKGASSAVYGSDAVGGVIHVITRAFAAQQPTPMKQLQARTALGEYGLNTFDLGGYMQDQNTTLAGGVISNNSNGQPQRGTRGYFHNLTSSLSYRRLLNGQWTLSLRTAYDRRNFSAQNFYTTFTSDTAKEQVKTFWSQASLRFRGSRNQLAVNLGYKKGEDIFTFNSGAAANRNQSSLAQVMVIGDHQLSGGSMLTAGLQFQNKAIQSNDRGNHLLKQAAVFALYNYSVGYFTIVPALRLDWDETAGPEWIPQLNLSFRKGSWQLRGSAGKTIRQPDFTERFNNYNKTTVAAGSIGNPDLHAETSFSYEAGADLFLKGLRISATGFRREQSDVIDWINTPYNNMPRQENLLPAGSYALASNISTLNTSGLETDIFCTQQIGDHQELAGQLGLLWLDSKSNQSAPSYYISSHARFLANWNIRYSKPGFSIAATGLCKIRNAQSAASISTEVDKEFFVLNARTDVFLLDGRMDFFIQVDNILDRSSSDLLGAMLPGRWTMAGCKWQLFNPKPL